jgi:agmatinase
MTVKPVIQTFLNKETPTEKADYVFFGAPLDETTSNRKGTRFAPTVIRNESLYLDAYSSRTGLGWDDLNLRDIGDIECFGVDKSLKDIEDTILGIDSLPVMVGGEHTITLGALRALKPGLVIVYDAHLDLRDTLFDETMCHATYLRRSIEELDFRAIIIGARALSKEEVEFEESNPNINMVFSQNIIKNGSKKIIKMLNEEIDSSDSLYLSIDMDVLDPSFAPAVGNPHPEGITTTHLVDMIQGSMSKKLCGFDLNEVYPFYDKGNTATTAAYIILETLFSHSALK